jgi:hypothetical protein
VVAEWANRHAKCGVGLASRRTGLVRARAASTQRAGCRKLTKRTRQASLCNPQRPSRYFSSRSRSSGDHRTGVAAGRRGPGVRPPWTLARLETLWAQTRPPQLVRIAP